MSVMILNGVHPKAGRLASGAYSPHSPVTGEPFGHKGSPAPWVIETADRLSAFNTSTVKADGNPHNGKYNRSTQPHVPAATITRPGSIAPPLARRFGGNVPLIQPHEHGRTFGESQRQVIRNTGGPGKNGQGQKPDTPKNPRKGRVLANRPKRTSALAGERASAASFRSNVRLLADAQFKPHDGAARWATVKRGAAG